MRDVYCPGEIDDYTLFHEDCLCTTRRFPSDSIDLIYGDPPFFSRRLYDLHGYSFDDRWDSLQEYLDWIEPRLKEFKRILKPTGSIYIHCDWHISHNLKVLADNIFARKNFLNEIIWKRQSSHNDAKQGSRHFGRIHDTILVYTMSPNYIWNQQYVPYDDSYLERSYKFVESETERRYALGDLSGPGGAGKKNPRYEFLGIKRYWRYGKTRMLKLLDEGRIVHRKGRVPKLKRYLDEMKGKPLQDVWTDIKPEYHGKIKFPTQKPEALLDRIIETSSNPDQIVYDPFTGSGTSGAVCFKLSRRWIGSEILENACHLTVDRLRALGCEVKFYSGLVFSSSVGLTKIFLARSRK